MAFLGYQAVELPLRLAFEQFFYTPASLRAFLTAEFAMDIAFFADLVLNFFVAYVDEDMEVVTMK